MQRVLAVLSPAAGLFRREFRRNLGATSVVYAQASDPIQKIFVEKLHEYVKKSKSAPGGLVDASPETERNLQAELQKLRVQYGGSKDADMTKFPSYSFKDPQLDPFLIDSKQ